MESSPLSEYEVGDLLGSNSASYLLHHGIRKADRRKVLIKIYNKPSEMSQKVAEFQRDFLLGFRCAGSPRVCKYLLGTENIVILEDYGGIPLDTATPLLYSKNGNGLLRFLNIACQMLEGLVHIHGRNIVHASISPSIFLCDSEDNVKYSSFNYASFESYIETSFEAPKTVDVAFQSPEQILYLRGGDEEYIDDRTDIYSLGLVFYLLLTGCMPWGSENLDEQEVQHKHLAGFFQPISDRFTEVPGALGDVIMTMLEKDKRRRYDSATALLSDITRCRDSIATVGKIGKVPLSVSTLSRRVRFAPKLYGRSSEKAILEKAVLSVEPGSCKIVFISGESGVGKTALVNSIRSRVVSMKGRIIEAKYEQPRSDSQEETHGDIIVTLFSQLVSLAKENSQYYVELIRKELGRTLPAVASYLPGFFEQLGYDCEYGEIAQSDAASLQNQIKVGLCSLLRCFGTSSSMLVLFLDDLQWADEASLGILKSILLADIQYLFFVGAFRIPVVTTLTDLIESATDCTHIELSGIDLDAQAEMSSELLSFSTSEAKKIAEILNSKTRGNPLSFRLAVEKAIESRFIVHAGLKWSCDFEALRSLDITDDVAQMLMHNVGKFPIEVIEVLQVAACIGSVNFPSDLLVNAVVTTPEEYLPNINKCFKSNPQSSKSEIIVSKLASAIEMIGQNLSGYRFLHDSIISGLLKLIPAGVRQGIQLGIGLVFLSRNDQSNCVEHLNQCIDLVNDKQIALEASKLNMEAAIRGRVSFNDELFYQGCQNSWKFLEKCCNDPWEDNQEFTLKLFRLTVHSLARSNKLNESKKLVEENLHRLSWPLVALIYRDRLVTQVYQGAFTDALDACFGFFESIGIPIPTDPAQQAAEVKTMYVEFEKKMEKISVRELGEKLQQDREKSMRQKPQDVDEHARELDLVERGLGLDGSEWLASYHTGKPLITKWTILKQTLSLLEKFQWKGSPLCLASIATFLLNENRRFRLAYEINEMAIELARSFNDALSESRCAEMLGAYSGSYIMPFRQNQSHFLQAHNLCVESGEFLFAGYCFNHLALSTIIEGRIPLQETLLNMEAHVVFMKAHVPNVFKVYYQMLIARTHHVMGKTASDNMDFDDFSTKEYEELIMSLKAPSLTLCLAIPRLLPYFLAKEWTLFWEAANIMVEIEDEMDIMSSPWNIAYAEAISILSMAICRALFLRRKGVKGKGEVEFPWSVEKAQCLLDKYQDFLCQYSELCPSNWLSYALIVKGMSALYQEPKDRGFAMLIQSLSFSCRNKATLHEAIAAEMVLQIVLDLNTSRKSLYMSDEQGLDLLKSSEVVTEGYFVNIGEGAVDIFLQRCLLLYMKYGAHRAVESVRKTYEDLLKKNELILPPYTVSEDKTNSSESERAGDVKKISELLTDSENSQAEMTNLLRQYTGADKAIIFVKRSYLQFDSSEGLCVVCFIPTDESNLEAKLNIEDPVAEYSTQYSSKIINEVYTTGETVIIADSQAEDYSMDPYLDKSLTRSVACLPVSVGGKIVSIIWLENTQFPNAFNGILTGEKLNLTVQSIVAPVIISKRSAKSFEAVHDMIKKVKESESRLRELLLDMPIVFREIDFSEVVKEARKWTEKNKTDLIKNEQLVSIVGKEKIIFQNRAAEKVRSLLPCFESTSIADLANFVASLIDFRQSFEVEAHYSNGSVVWWHFVVAKGHENTHDLVYCFGVDMTHQRHLQHMLEQMVEERTAQLRTSDKERIQALQQAAEAHSQMADRAEDLRLRQIQFVDTLCHEIRNPLNGIMAVTEVFEMDMSLAKQDKIKNDDLFNEFESGLGDISQCSSHLREIVDNVLDYSKMESNRIVIESNPFSPFETIDAACRMYRVAAKTKNIELSLDLTQFPSDVQVLGDRNRVIQVVSNLISNAIKFSPEGGKVDLSLSLTEENWKITVRDNGIGMDEDVKSGLFSPFHQGTPDKTKFGGSGLGLLISKKLVNSMKGSIEVESIESEGTKMSVVFPLVRARIKETDTGESVLSPKRTSEFSGKTVLLVDDVELNLRTVGMLLKKKLKLDVIVARNGLEACQSVEKMREKIDLIIMDLEMPVMDGYDAIERIRAVEAELGQERVPCIAFSGYVAPDRIKRATDVGMDGYLSKPVNLKELKRLLSQFLQLS